MRVRRFFLSSVLGALSFSGVAAADQLAAGDPAQLFAATDVVTGITMPTSFAFLPDGRMLITQKTGQLILAAKDPEKPSGAFTNTKLVATFTVDTESEKGLLHVILHPAFKTNHLLIFYYSAADSIGGTDEDRHRVVTVPFDPTLGTLDMTKEVILVRGLHGPVNHDGGALAIGPDGMLYIGDGDTGCNSNKAPVPLYNPTNYFATCLTLPNGKILRVNLDGSIPKDNPLVGKQVTACGAACATNALTLPLAPAREDIWAWGFRNPWRFWFDPKTKNLWVGDVGEVTYEELDIIPPSGKGKHYGWPWREGGQGHPRSTCQEITPNAGDCVEPAYYCKHGATPQPLEGGLSIDDTCEAIMGGLIVDSCEFPPAYRGLYWFGDNSDSWIGTLQPTPDRNGIVYGSRKMFSKVVGGGPVHFEIGPDHALYYAEIIGATTGSKVERLFPKAPLPACPAESDGGSRSDAAVSGGGSTGATGGGSSADGHVSGSSGGNGNAAGGAGAPGAGNKLDASIDGGHVVAKSGETSSCACAMAKRGAEPGALALGVSLSGVLLGRRARRRRYRSA